jgi:glycosyltransferase involved in cell wall biosynthesis
VLHRILHIIDSLGHTGTSRQLLLLAQGLARQGFHVHIAVLNAMPNAALPFRGWPGDDSTNLASTIPILNIGRRFPIDPLADMRLVRHIARLQPDIVHTWNTLPAMLGPIASGSWRRLSIRGRAVSKRPQIVGGQYRIDRWKPEWQSWFERRFANHVAAYVTNSAAVRKWWATHGLPAEKCTLIPPGVPAAAASNVSRDELLQELHLPADARLIGVIGRLVPEKRVRDLIWAADLLRVLHDNLRMLIIGTGPLRTQLEQYARLASDLDHIRFLGECNDVWRIMPHVDVLWNGSDNRSVSIAMLEAMAAGVPVIATDVPVNRELVVHGETGYLVPVGHRSGRADRARHTDRIFTDASLAARLDATATRHANNNFSCDAIVRQHIELYNFVVE